MAEYKVFHAFMFAACFFLFVSTVVLSSVLIDTSNQLDELKEKVSEHEEVLQTMYDLWLEQQEYNDLNTEMWNLQLELNEYI